MASLAWEQQPELRRPVLVAGFEGWNDAASAASEAAGWLTRQFGATKIASMDPEELAGAVLHARRGAAAPRAEPALTTDEHESRQALWQYFLMAAFLLLATETVLSNRLSSRARALVKKS